MPGRPHSFYPGMSLLRALADDGRVVFTIEDARQAAQDVGVAPTYLKQLLRRLADSDWIRRVKRGTYAISGGLPGLAPEPHPFAIGMALVDPSAVSGWAALNHHGLTEQIPRIITLTTTRRIATPAMRGAVESAPSTWRVGEQEFEIVSVVRAHFFGFEEVWLGESRVRIFDRERALLDCFALPRRFGGVAEGLAILEAHLHELDIDRLVAHAKRYGKVAVAKRVGYALESAGVEAKRIERLRRLPIKGYRLLDPTRPARGRSSSRWGLRDNLRPKKAA